MSKNTKTLLCIFFTLTFLSGCGKTPSATPVKGDSLILYNAYPARHEVSNGIFNVDTGEVREVGRGLKAVAWSPSGKYILYFSPYYTDAPEPISLWVSDAHGNNLRKVFDAEKNQNLEISTFDWFRDDTIFVDIVNREEKKRYLYALNADDNSFQPIPNQPGFSSIPRHADFWITYIDKKYYLMNMDGVSTEFQHELFFNGIFYSYENMALSPDGRQVMAFGKPENQKGDLYESKLYVADIDMYGISNEREIATLENGSGVGENTWSPDGKLLATFAYYHGRTPEWQFRAVDVATGKVAYEWTWELNDTNIFWSPRSDKIISYTGNLLDLKTGEFKNVFAELPKFGNIQDWRLIESP